MAITPTVMIAAAGLLVGGGIGSNSNQTTAISQSLSNPLITAYTSVSTNSNVGNVAGLSSTLSSLPNIFSQTSSNATNVPAQAAQLSPNPSTFITLHNGATAFGSSSMDYGAALSTYGSKSFGDLGVGVNNFTDANSGGLTSLLPGFGALAASAKTSAFGGIGGSLDPATLAQGQASISSSALKGGLQGVGTGLNNYGSLMDFSNPQSLGYQGMLVSLQKQGLADSVGINDAISAAGYDPKVPSIVPDSVLKIAFSNVTGSDLQKIITQTGSQPITRPSSLNDLMDPSFMMPPDAMAAMGLKPGSGATGLKSLGNTMTNIGVPMDNVTASKLMGGVQTNVGGYLSGLSSLVPASVTATLGPMIGTGSSPFGTPQMKDMMGSASGVHTPQFQNINTQFSAISGSSAGQQLTTALQNMNTALTTNVGTAGAYSALQAAVTNFNNQVSGNSQFGDAVSSIQQSNSTITAQLSKETSNFSLAGINLASPPSAPSGSGQVLGFASKLHSFGVDKSQLGHNDVMNGVATNDLTGDAIKASLLEGKNVATMASVGKSAPTVSDTQAALASSNADNIGQAVTTFQAEVTARNQAVSTANETKAQFVWLNNQYKANPSDTVVSAQWDIAKANTVTALQAQTTALQAYDQALNNLTALGSGASQGVQDKIAEVLSEAKDSLVSVTKLSLS